jgi:hypothetical protein
VWKLRAYNYLPFFIGLLSGLWFITSGSIGSGMVFIPGDLGDARFNNYLLEHGYLFLKGDVPSFWNAPFMYPEENVITYSDNLLGTMPFYALFRTMGFDRETAFQLWTILMTIFNYAAAYFFIRALFRNNYAAVCGAMIFAFSIALQSQIGHAQTYPRFMAPLAMWMGILYLRELRVRYFFLMLVMLVYQFYCGFYMGFMLAVPVGILFIFSLIVKRGLYLLKVRDTRWSVAMTASIITNILIIYPLLSPYMDRAKHTGMYKFDEIVENLPTPLSYIYSHHGSLFWDFLKEVAVKYPAFWDHQIFPGAIALLSLLSFIVFFILRSTNRGRFLFVPFDLNTKALFFAGIVTMALFIRFGHFSFYKIIFPLPGFGSMRALQRIINLELLFMGTAVACIVSWICKREKIMSIGIFPLLCLLIILDNRIHPDTVHKYLKEEGQTRVTSLRNNIPTMSHTEVLSYEPDTIAGKQIYYHLDAMIASQSMGIKTLNGYSATAPDGYSEYWIKPNEETRKIWLHKKKLDEKLIVVVH